MALSLLLLMAAGPPHMVFHGKSQWVLTDATGEVVRRFTTLGDYEPLELAVSRDGSIAFTARKAGSQPHLYVWNGTTALLLSTDDGYHGAPTFSLDGTEIVYAHHPSPESGPIGMHAAGANAQLWKISVKGGASVQLTNSPGCKGTPHFAGRDLVILAHSTCDGHQGVETISTRAPSRAKTVLDPKGLYSEPRISADLSWIAYGSRHYDDTRIIVSPLAFASVGKTVATVRGHPYLLGLHWSPDSRYLYFVQDNELRRFDSTTERISVVSSQIFEGMP